jgi:cytochrome c peroxidase
MAKKGARALEPAHYAAVLADVRVLEDLGRPRADGAEVAKELHKGYSLFTNRDDGRTNCVACHSGRQFSDEGFHNMGVDAESSPPGQERGRFATVPVGQKNRYLIDAYRTPTLRSLGRTAPYLHNGTATELSDVVAHHARANTFLDPLMRNSRGGVRGDDLEPGEVEALVLFLRALQGDDPDPVFRTPP